MEPHGHSPWHPSSRPSGATSRPNAGAFIHGQSPWLSAAGVNINSAEYAVLHSDHPLQTEFTQALRRGFTGHWIPVHRLEIGAPDIVDAVSFVLPGTRRRWFDDTLGQSEVVVWMPSRKLNNCRSVWIRSPVNSSSSAVKSHPVTARTTSTIGMPVHHE